MTYVGHRASASDVPLVGAATGPTRFRDVVAAYLGTSAEDATQQAAHQPELHLIDTAGTPEEGGGDE